MYISSRAAVTRNFGIAIVNGTVTLIILLIAPLGLAAVVANTFLVTAASFFTGTAADTIIRFLQPSDVQQMQAHLETDRQSSQIRRSDDSTDLDRH